MTDRTEEVQGPLGEEKQKRSIGGRRSRWRREVSNFENSMQAKHLHCCGHHPLSAVTVDKML